MTAVYLKPGLVDQLKAKHGIPTDEEFASLIGCHRTTLHRLRRHEQGMSVVQVAALSARFGVPYSEITSERNNSERSDPVHDPQRGG